MKIGNFLNELDYDHSVIAFTISKPFIMGILKSEMTPPSILWFSFMYSIASLGLL